MKIFSTELPCPSRLTLSRRDNADAKIDVEYDIVANGRAAAFTSRQAEGETKPFYALDVDANDQRDVIVEFKNRRVRPWKYGPYASLDLETTGIDADARIVEIAIVRMRYGVLLNRWSTLVNPGIPIPPEATAVHGITDAMVADAPTIGELHGVIAEQLAGVAVIIGYNIYHFDGPKLGALGIPVGPAPIIDPYVVVRTKPVSGSWPSTWTPREEPSEDDDLVEIVRPATRRKVGGKYSLTNVSRMFLRAGGLATVDDAPSMRCDAPEPGVEIEFHRAEFDALCCGRLFWALRFFLAMADDARESEINWRREGDRQNAWLERFKAEKDEEDRKRRVARRAAREEREARDREAGEVKLRAWFETFVADKVNVIVAAINTRNG